MFAQKGKWTKHFGDEKKKYVYLSFNCLAMFSFFIRLCTRWFLQFDNYVATVFFLPLVNCFRKLLGLRQVYLSTYGFTLTADNYVPFVTVRVFSAVAYEGPKPLRWPSVYSFLCQECHRNPLPRSYLRPKQFSYTSLPLEGLKWCSPQRAS